MNFAGKTKYILAAFLCCLFIAAEIYLIKRRGWPVEMTEWIAEIGNLIVFISFLIYSLYKIVAKNVLPEREQ
jgi:hypothetical protein